jgi:hypothetical protein
MNIQHSQRTDEWGTPKSIMNLVRDLLGTIDLDPASDAHFNRTVDAYYFFTKEDGDSLTRPWLTPAAPTEAAIFLNPPGGKTCNKSNVVLFWQKLMDEVDAGHVKHAIFMGFSIECLQTTQQCSRAVPSYPICIPRSRLRFDRKSGLYNAPSHASVIAYIPGTVDETERFISIFQGVGMCKR